LTIIQFPKSIAAIRWYVIHWFAVVLILPNTTRRISYGCRFYGIDFFCNTGRRIRACGFRFGGS
jgi:hypothetical protein